MEESHELFTRMSLSYCSTSPPPPPPPPPPLLNVDQVIQSWIFQAPTSLQILANIMYRCIKSNKLDGFKLILQLPTVEQIDLIDPTILLQRIRDGKGHRFTEPLFLSINAALFEWYNQKKPPTNLATPKGFVEVERNETLPEVSNMVISIIDLILNNGGVDTTSQQDDKNMVRLFQIIGEERLAYLLGMRKTAGTILGEFCPSLRLLKIAFVKPQHPDILLHVGARALTKHCHRPINNSTNFWGGEIKGNAQEKNKIAEGKFLSICENAVWFNCHVSSGMLNGVHEIRNNKGYGVRFQIEKEKSLVFRGFLEPMMENGHEKGWKH
jgi:hypothetical protein